MTTYFGITQAAGSSCYVTAMCRLCAAYVTALQRLFKEAVQRRCILVIIFIYNRYKPAFIIDPHFLIPGCYHFPGQSE